MPETPIPLNILWFGNATWCVSGYANQARIWTRRLRDRGYGVVVSAFVGLEGKPIADDAGIVHLGHVKERFNNDIIQSHVIYAQALYPNQRPTDLVLSLVDVFAMDAAVWRNLCWAAIDPVDCEPILQVKRAQLAACRFPVAMSRHGEAQMKAIGLNPLYMPHGIETQVFKPVDRTLARQKMAEVGLIEKIIPDSDFLVIAVGANGIGKRKNWSGIFESFQFFLQDHPNAWLYCHADPEGVHGQPIQKMAQQLDIAHRTLFPQSAAMVMGLATDEHLNYVYNAADIKLMLSYGEGFGLTDVEAQSAGTPIVATHFGASIELNFTGWPVNGYLYQTEPMSYQMIADPQEAAARLHDAYTVWQNGGMPALRAKTRQAALQYDADAVLDAYMIPALNQIARELQRTPQAAWLKQRTQPNGPLPKLTKPLDYGPKRVTWRDRIK